MTDKQTKDDLLAKMSEVEACDDATEWVESQEGTAQQIWDKCERGDWMLWLAAKCGVDRKQIVKAACLCARTALKYVPAGEKRPRIAIETAERWLQNEATLDEVRKAAAAAAAYAAAAAAAAAAYAAAAAADAADAYAYASAASAAAYAASAAYAYAYAADARKAALKQCADIIRTIIKDVPR